MSIARIPLPSYVAGRSVGSQSFLGRPVRRHQIDTFRLAEANKRKRSDRLGSGACFIGHVPALSQPVVIAGRTCQATLNHQRLSNSTSAMQLLAPFKDSRRIALRGGVLSQPAVPVRGIVLRWIALAGHHRPLGFPPPYRSLVAFAHPNATLARSFLPYACQVMEMLGLCSSTSIFRNPLRQFRRISHCAGRNHTIPIDFFLKPKFDRSRTRCGPNW
jgi:hypothetical protein